MNLTDDVESEVSDSGELAFRLTVSPDEAYHHRVVSGRNGSSWCRQHSVSLNEMLTWYPTPWKLRKDVRALKRISY